MSKLRNIPNIFIDFIGFFVDSDQEIHLEVNFKELSLSRMGSEKIV